MFAGSVVAVHIAPAPGAPVIALDEATIVEGVGIAGDRYAVVAVPATTDGRRGRQVTLIESEAVTAAAAEYDIPLDAARTRRNIVTRGVPLNHLVGRRFRVGDAVLEGVRLCEPCRVMDEVFGAPARRALVHRGGLRADIVTGGVVRPGDPVEPV